MADGYQVTSDCGMWVATVWGAKGHTVYGEDKWNWSIDPVERSTDTVRSALGGENVPRDEAIRLAAEGLERFVGWGLPVYPSRPFEVSEPFDCPGGDFGVTDCRKRAVVNLAPPGVVFIDSDGQVFRRGAAAGSVDMLGVGDWYDAEDMGWPIRFLRTRAD